MGVPVFAGMAVAADAAFTVPTSGRGHWSRVHADATLTAETAPHLLTPTLYSTFTNAASIFPFLARTGKSIVVMARYPIGVTAITTQPIIQIYGSHSEPDPATGAYATTAKPIRLDTDTAGAAGVTLTLSTTSDLRDATYYYSAVKYCFAPLDLQGCKSGLILAQTAAVLATVTTPLEIFVSVLN